jgi:plastocyanin
MSLSSRRALFFAASIGALLPGASPAAAVPRTYTIVIDKMRFGPLPVQLHRGDSIVWVNRDFLRHSATAADHSFDVDLPANAKGKMVLKKNGAIPFTCRYHPGMRGVLRVQ